MQDAWRMADGVAARETRHPMAYTVDCAAIEADGAANADGPVAASFGRRGLWCQGRPGSEYCPLPEGRPFASGCWDARMDGCRARAPDHRGWKSDGATAGVGSMDGASTCVLTPPATSRPCPTLSVSITPETLLSPILDAPSLWSPHGAHPGCELLQDARVYGTEVRLPRACTRSPTTWTLDRCCERRGPCIAHCGPIVLHGRRARPGVPLAVPFALFRDKRSS